MNARTTIRKILFVTIWLCIGGGMFTLLLAAISKKNRGLCRDYRIVLNGAEKNFFIDTKDVEAMLVKATKGPIRGTAVSAFNLNELEGLLKKNEWISDAELYFDNQDVLHVSITEREPVARIFTMTGRSFYIDSTGLQMPLSDKLSARVPVFTGFPDRMGITGRDSVLLQDVKMTANYIVRHPFWLSQVAQIDITPERKMEMIPVVGNHLVRLGDGEHIDAKFNRLMIFYQQVLSRTGFEKYKLIDVQYKGQVVVSRYAGDPRVDSVQLRRNVEKLLSQSIEAANDTVIKAMPPLVQLEADSVLAPDPSLQDKPAIETGKEANPVPVKSVLPQKDVKKDKPKPVKKVKEGRETIKEPRAVMPKKPAEDENGGYN